MTLAKAQKKRVYHETHETIRRNKQEATEETEEEGVGQSILFPLSLIPLFSSVILSCVSWFQFFLQSLPVRLCAFA